MENNNEHKTTTNTEANQGAEENQDPSKAKGRVQGEANTGTVAPYKEMTKKQVRAEANHNPDKRMKRMALQLLDVMQKVKAEELANLILVGDKERAEQQLKLAQGTIRKWEAILKVKS
jgi:hypothetical protein